MVLNFHYTIDRRKLNVCYGRILAFRTLKTVFSLFRSDAVLTGELAIVFSRRELPPLSPCREKTVIIASGYSGCYTADLRSADIISPPTRPWISTYWFDLMRNTSHASSEDCSTATHVQRGCTAVFRSSVLRVKLKQEAEIQARGVSGGEIISAHLGSDLIEF